MALAVALWQFALLSFTIVHGTRWLDYVLPWLSRLLISAPVVALGVVVGCLTRPQRPERRAAVIGALATLLIWLPLAFSAGALRPAWSLSATWLCLSLTLGGAEAAVSAWVGANYWRRGNWAQFWNGPGGAILKGGMVAGLASVAVGIAHWYGPLGEAFRSEALAIGVTIPPIPLSRIITEQLGRIGWYAMITAMLVSWRPTKLIGAFAGSGISLGLFVISMVYNAWVNRTMGHPMPSLSVLSVLAILFTRAMPGAIAGFFAGRWRDEPTE